MNTCPCLAVSEWNAHEGPLPREIQGPSTEPFAVGDDPGSGYMEGDYVEDMGGEDEEYDDDDGWMDEEAISHGQGRNASLPDNSLYFRDLTAGKSLTCNRECQKAHVHQPVTIRGVVIMFITHTSRRQDSVKLGFHLWKTGVRWFTWVWNCIEKRYAPWDFHAFHGPDEIYHASLKSLR